MKVWTNVWSDKEWVSDSYKYAHLYNDAALEVKAKMVTKNDGIQIGDEEAVDDSTAEQVCNVVDAHQLVETNLSKKDFMALVKPFLKRTVAYLKENGKEARVPEFQKGATEFVKFIVSRFDEMQMYTDQDCNVEDGIIFAYNKDGEIDPTFLFFTDCCKEEKF